MKKKNNLPIGYVEITHGRYYARKEANAFAEKIGKPETGEKIPYFGVAGKSWYKVRIGDKFCFIPAQAGKAVEVKQTYLTVKKGNWHVRAGADSKSKSLGVVTGGDKILDQGETKGTFRLVSFMNQNGWIPTRAIEKE